MPIRNAKQAAQERAIFDAFLRAHPRFAETLAQPPEQPDAEFPDITVTLKDGSQIDFELAEWLHSEQMAQGKRREMLVTALESAIGEQGENSSTFIRCILLDPHPDYPLFQAADRKGFHDQLWSLIAEIESRWPSERFWHSPQGHHHTDFSPYPIVGKYIASSWFVPFNTNPWNGRENWPPGQPWINCTMHCTSYSPDISLDALVGRLHSKIEHYGPLSRPVRLLVYYNKAVVFNTPWYGPDCRTFRDVAEKAAQAVANQRCFETIYLLSALEPGLEAYEIFPLLLKCESG